MIFSAPLPKEALRGGFTLLELAIVLTIISVVIGGALVVFTANLQATEYNTTIARMDALDKALYNFSVANDRLPCPGDLTLTPSSLYYGLEAGAYATSSIRVGTGVCTGTGMLPKATSVYSASNASEGGVPTRALQLPDSFMYDGWGRRFRYAVDASMTLVNSMHSTTIGTQCSGSSSLTIYDSSVSTATPRSTTAIYALISHGANGYGAYTSNGTQVNASNATTNEQTNCHCNGVTTYSPTYVEEAIGADNTSGTGPSIDDIVSFKEYWQMQAPFDTTASCGNYMYVADSSNNRIEIINTSGSYMDQIGCSSGKCTPSSTTGSVSLPNSAAVDSGGNIWVADTGYNRIDKFSSSGTWLGQLGSTACSTTTTCYSTTAAAGAGGTGSGYFSSPKDVAIDSRNNIWVVDSANNRVQEFSSTGLWIGQLGGNNATYATCPSSPNTCMCSSTTPCGSTSGSTTGAFNAPTALAFDPSGNLWVVDSSNNRMEEFTVSYTASPNTVTYNTSVSNASVTNPQAIAFDKSGNMWVTTGTNDKVYEFTLSGTTYNTASPTSNGASGSGNGQFYSTGGAQGIAFDPSYNMWVVDNGGNRVEEFSSGFTYKTQVGSCSSGACGTSSANPGFTAPQYIHSGR